LCKADLLGSLHAQRQQQQQTPAKAVVVRSSQAVLPDLPDPQATTSKSGITRNLMSASLRCSMWLLRQAACEQVRAVGTLASKCVLLVSFASKCMLLVTQSSWSHLCLDLCKYQVS
jgi:hypothetical protein